MRYITNALERGYIFTIKVLKTALMLVGIWSILSLTLTWTDAGHSITSFINNINTNLEVQDAKENNS